MEGIYRMLSELTKGDARLFLVSLVVLLITVVLWFVIGNRRRNLPPGPYGLPFLGYLPFLTKRPYLKFEELKKRYGPVYSMQLGSRFAIVLCDYDSIKEAYAQDAFNGRPPDSSFQFNKESVDLGVLNGPGWLDHRKHSIQVLKALGFGKEETEQLLNDEINELLSRFEQEVGKPIITSNFLAPSMSNNMSMFMFGKRRKFDDPKRVLLDGIVRNIGILLPQAAWHSFFPWIRRIVNMLGLGSRKRLMSTFKQFRAYIKEEIAEHQQSFEPSIMRDYIDGYLQEMEKRKSVPNSVYQLAVLEDQVFTFFAAGSETVRISMDWLLLICATYPNILKKVQEEIDDVVGSDRLPSRLDQKLMPFTEAVMDLIHEEKKRSTEPYGTYCACAVGDACVQEAGIYSSIWQHFAFLRHPFSSAFFRSLFA